MAKAKNGFERLASDAAKNLDRAHAMGEQLSLLPGEPDTASIADPSARGKGKTGSQLRSMLAQRGLRMPEDVLAEMAGLASSQDAFLTAMARTEQLVAWAWKDGTATPVQRLNLFMQIYTAQLRALDALLPYGLAKVTPDAAPTHVTQVIVSGGGSGQAQPGANRARDVTPQDRRIAPPPMPHEMQGNQQVSEPASRGSDKGTRTE